MYLIPEYAITATLADGTAISLRVQKPDLEGVVRTLVESDAQMIRITPFASARQGTSATSWTNTWPQAPHVRGH